MKTRAGDVPPVLAGAVVVMSLCGVVVTTLLVRREIGPTPPEPPDRTRGYIAAQPDWQRYATGRRVGPAHAPVAVVDFSDYQCPACRVLEQRLQASRERFGADRFAVVVRHLPLGKHTHARAAAYAAECAGQQGRFEAMHHTLFAVQDSLSSEKWDAWATRAGVSDLPAFAACLVAPATGARVDADRSAAAELQARGTPTLLVGATRIAGVPTQPVLDSLIAEALAVVAAERR